MDWSPYGAVAVLLCSLLLVGAVPAGATGATGFDATDIDVSDAVGGDAAAGAGDAAAGADDAAAGADDAAAGADDAAAGADGPTNSASDAVSVTYEYRLTPAEPGEIEVLATLSVPSSVTSVDVWIPSNATLSDRQGFERDEDTPSRLHWDAGDATPSVTFTVPVNVTGEGSRRRYYSVDAGSMALFDTPRLTVDALADGSRVDIDERFTTAGPGYATRPLTYLGPHETYTTSTPRGTVTLVEPAAANITAGPRAVRDALARAARTLRIGNDSGPVVAVAAPQRTVEWAPEGLTIDSDEDETRTEAFWVRDDTRLDEPGYTWVHEYVHTRQAFETTTRTRWLTEASGTYYAALDALDANRIDFGTFRDFLTRGGSDGFGSADDVLADPKTWGSRTDYLKGALVVGQIDRRIRLASDGSHSFASVLRRLPRDRPTGIDTFLDAVGAVSNDTVREFAERQVRSETAPSMWTVREHAQAFDSTGGVDYRLRDRVSISGAYRNGSLPDWESTVAVGERVSVDVVVRNVGGSAHNYSLPVTVNSTTTSELSGRVGPGETDRITVNWTFGSPDRYDISIVGEEFTIVAVRPPFTTVTSVAANRTQLTGGGAVELSATVRQVGREAETSTVTFDQGLGTVAEHTVTLKRNETTTVNATVTLSEPGTYEYRVRGGGTVTVTVNATGTATPGATGTPDTTGPSDETADGTADGAGKRTRTESDSRPANRSTTGGSGPGFGLGAATLAALVGGALAALRRRHR